MPNQLTAAAKANIKRENLIISIGAGIVLAAYFVAFILASHI